MSKHDFTAKLFEAACGMIPPSLLKSQSNQIMDAFLDFGSETDDNLNCHRHIEYGLATDDRSKEVLGLKVVGKNILLSSIMNVVENMDLPEEVRKEFPGLSQEEWDAVTRMVTVLLLAIENDTD